LTRSNNEKKDMDRMRTLINNHGRIRIDVLIEKAQISISRYNQLKTIFELKYENEFKYNKENKEWISFASLETEDAKKD